MMAIEEGVAEGDQIGKFILKNLMTEIKPIQP